MRKRHRSVDAKRVLEQPFDEPHVASVWIEAVAVKRRGHGLEQIGLITVVRGALDALRTAAANLLIAAMDVRTIFLARRRNHAKHVVHVEQALESLRRRNDEGGPAERTPRLDEQARQPLPLDRLDCPMQVIETRRRR